MLDESWILVILWNHFVCVNQFRNYKIIYKRYAGLFFCFCVDTNDNELAYLELIHLFVETLDTFFQNVCELDLVFNFFKVCCKDILTIFILTTFDN